MSQKEETVRKLSQLRSSLTSGESNELLDTVDLDTDGVSRGRVVGEVVGRRIGGILGRRMGERLDRVFDERFGGGTVLASVADALADVFTADEESETDTDTENSSEPDETSEDEAREDEGSEDEASDSEVDVSEMSTEDLQSLATQLMNELQQRSDPSE